MTSRVDTPAEDATVSRRCGYRECNQPLPSREGRGPKYRYCPDRTWPGGKGCKEMAALERASHRAAGLDVCMDTFRTVADQLADAAEPLAETLAAVLDALDEVAAGALSRVGEADIAAAAAAERAEAAHTSANQAVAARQQADAARDRARAEAADADRRARAVRVEADEQIATATERLAVAERERGQAQATAVAAVAAAGTDGRRREEAERQLAEARMEVRALHEQLEAARGGQAQARVEVGDATRRADLADADNTRLGEQYAALIGQARRADAALTAARAQAVEDQATIAKLREQGEQLHRLVAEASAEAARDRARAEAAGQASEEAQRLAQSTEARAERAERRLDALVSGLRDRR